MYNPPRCSPYCSIISVICRFIFSSLYVGFSVNEWDKEYKNCIEGITNHIHALRFMLSFCLFYPQYLYIKHTATILKTTANFKQSWHTQINMPREEVLWILSDGDAWSNDFFGFKMFIPGFFLGFKTIWRFVLVPVYPSQLVSVKFAMWMTAKWHDMIILCYIS